MNSEITEVLLGFSATLFTILVAVLGWIGSRVHSKLDEINRTLSSIEHDLRKDLSGLDRRVARLEGRRSEDV